MHGSCKLVFDVESFCLVFTLHGHVAVSNQGMQDHLGAKSANWLAVFSTSFPISPSQAMKEPLNENEGRAQNGEGLRFTCLRA